MVLAPDLVWLADRAKLTLTMPSGELPAEAERVGQAFDTYSIGKRLLDRVAPEALKRDWCQSVAEQAHDLLLALGHLDDRRIGAGGIRFRDGMQTLGLRPPVPGSERDKYDLESLAWRIDPSRMQRERLAGNDGVTDVWWHFMHQRMPAALEMLELMARRGAEGYAGHVTEGGRDRLRAREALFCDLAGSYERLFGKLPAVGRADAPDEDERVSVPAGPSLVWFDGLFRKVQQNARRLGRWPGALDQIPDADLDPQYGAVVELVDETLASKYADILAEVIPAGAKRWLNRPEPELPDPDHELPSLDDILGRGPI